MTQEVLAVGWTVQKKVTVVLHSSDRITPIKKGQQLQADGHFKHRRFL